MTKIISSFVLLFVFAIPASAFAASISLAPTSFSVKPGQTFTVSVTALPVGTKVYTVRANISFDPSVLSVTKFTFTPKWMPLSQPGYYTTDNTKGILVRTGGYPGGITSPTVMGTATFTAKKVGVAQITAGSKSLVLDANGKNTLSGTQGSVKVISLIPPLPKVTHKAKKTVYHATHKTVVKTAAQIAAAKAKAATAAAVAAKAATGAKAGALASTSATSTLPTQTAAASGSGSGSTGVPYAVAAGVIVLALLAWLNRKRWFSHAE